MTGNKKDAFIIIRIPKEIKEALVKKAARQGVKLSKLVRDILEEKI